VVCFTGVEELVDFTNSTARSQSALFRYASPDAMISWFADRKRQRHCPPDGYTSKYMSFNSSCGSRIEKRWDYFRIEGVGKASNVDASVAAPK
jgi:hypothetical protein